MGGWARLGILSEAVADVLNRIRPPFNVTSGAQAAGIAAVNDIEFLTRSRDHDGLAALAVRSPWRDVARRGTELR